MKCLVYAGRLAHYAADLEQPLHTTVDYDGRTQAAKDAKNKTFKSPHTGIHTKVDALPTKMPYDQLFKDPLPAPQARDDVFALVQEELRKVMRWSIAFMPWKMISPHGMTCR